MRREDYEEYYMMCLSRHTLDWRLAVRCQGMHELISGNLDYVRSTPLRNTREGENLVKKVKWGSKFSYRYSRLPPRRTEQRNRMAKHAFIIVLTKFVEKQDKNIHWMLSAWLSWLNFPPRIAMYCNSMVTKYYINLEMK